MRAIRQQIKCLRMGLSVRRFEQSDYPMLCSWWKEWQKPPVPLDWLTDTGFIVSSGKFDVCAVFLYLTNSSICHLDCMISNKNFTDKHIRRHSLQLAVQSAISLAHNMGRGVIFVQSNNKFIDRLVTGLNFTETNNIKYFFKVV